MARPQFTCWMETCIRIGKMHLILDRLDGNICSAAGTASEINSERGRRPMSSAQEKVLKALTVAILLDAYFTAQNELIPSLLSWLIRWFSHN